MNDTIYRRDAIQALVDTEEIKGFAYRMLEDRLMEIPSADQQQVDGAALISAMSLGYSYGIKANRPQGEWIDYRPYNIPLFDCSICGYHAKKMSNFCPNCGARMLAKDTNVPNKEGTDDE